MISRTKLSVQGPEFSRLIYGAWRLAENTEDTSVQSVLKKINVCLDAGITSFDHADIYGDYSCEEIFGAALKTDKSLLQKIELVTKCGIMLVSEKRPANRIKHYNTTADHIISSAERSLKNLGAEKIDLLLIHRPNPILNPEETGAAFDHLRRSGKVLHFGVSNFLPHQFNSLQSYLDFPLVTNQIEISPLRLDAFTDGTLDQCLEKRMSPMCWSPFAGGKMFSQQSETFRKITDELNSIAQRENCTMEEVILKWLTFSPHNILPIVGTNRTERIAAYRNFEKIHFTDQDWFRIFSAASGRDVP